MVCIYGVGGGMGMDIQRGFTYLLAFDVEMN